MAERKKDLRSITPDELSMKLGELGHPAFRARQVNDWLRVKAVTSVDRMTNLPPALRQDLGEYFTLFSATVADTQVSTDGTIKCAFTVDTDKVVEGVLIPTAGRMTACISSQAGCSLACKFCATGRLKMMRNLLPGEIVDQVTALREMALTHHNRPLSNVVLMGMGEPLLNYTNVMAALDLMTAPDGLGISPQRITLSTAGIAKQIMRMADDGSRVQLALSLHAANDAKRSRIMEINDSNNLAALTEALRHYHRVTGQRVTLEYIIFKDFNDSLMDARQLADFARCVPCKVNIIEYNPIDAGAFQRADAEKTEAFARFLQERCNMIVNVRRSRGQDIDAACGQLANKNAAALK